VSPVGPLWLAVLTNPRRPQPTCRDVARRSFLWLFAMTKVRSLYDEMAEFMRRRAALARRLAVQIAGPVRLRRKRGFGKFTTDESASGGPLERPSARQEAADRRVGEMREILGMMHIPSIPVDPDKNQARKPSIKE
jgi:hypothetical protein